MSLAKNLFSIKNPVTLLTLGHLWADIYSGFIVPILPLLSSKLSISLPMASLIVAFSGLTASLLQPIYGYFADKISRRFFIFNGLIVASVFISLTGVATNYFQLALFIIIGNIGVGLYHPQATAMITRNTSLQENLNMGIFVGGGVIGYAIGPLISSAIAEYLSLSWTLIAVIPGFVTAILMYLHLEKIEPKEVPPKFTNFISEIKKIKLILPIILGSIMIRAFVLLSASTFLPFEWENNLGFSVMQVGLIMTIYALLGGITSVLGGSFAQKYGEQKVLISTFSAALPILVLSMLLMNQNRLFGCILYVLGGSILMSSASINIVILQRLLPNNTGIASGLTGGFCWGIASLMLFPTGLIIHSFGFNTTIIPIITLLLLAVVLTLLVPINVYNDKKLKNA